MTGPEQVTVNELARKVDALHEEVTGLKSTVTPAVAFYARGIEAWDDFKGFMRALGRALKYGTAVGASIVTIFGGLRILGVV